MLSVLTKICPKYSVVKMIFICYIIRTRIVYFLKKITVIVFKLLSDKRMHNSFFLEQVEDINLFLICTLCYLFGNLVNTAWKIVPTIMAF